MTDGRTAVLHRVFRGIDVVLLAIGLAGVMTWMPDESGTRLLVVGVDVRNAS